MSGQQLALSCCPGEVQDLLTLSSAAGGGGQGQFFLVLKPVRDDFNSVQPYPLGLQ